MSGFVLADFENWLIRCGAEVLTPGAWEVLRIRSVYGVLVVHQNKKGVQNWQGQMLDLVKAYNAGQTLALAATRRRRKASRLFRDFSPLSKRDGSECFYCGQPVAPPDAPVPDDYRVTVEHLVAVAHGGPDHLSNKALTHFRCNQIAGNLSVAEKVRLREKMRADADGE